MISVSTGLHQEKFSLCHDEWVKVLSETSNLLIIQDLDGVCMGLVKDPLTRKINSTYVYAAQAFSPHFYVLTNGEHVGQRGVNQIIEKALGDPHLPQMEGLYLPGLAAGGVQWQDRFSQVEHPGVSQQELDFLKHIPHQIRGRIQHFFQNHTGVLSPEQVCLGLETAVLDNLASPTANLNIFYEWLRDRPDLYSQLQGAIAALMDELLQDAARQGMAHSFFVHYAPNLGRDAQGVEVLRPATAHDSGTTDFQFMLRGAVKEAGVVAILNHYYYQRTGEYPLGEDFNARHAPSTHAELLKLVCDEFSMEHMPLIVGVGDTVNSTVEQGGSDMMVRRGGSDRNFLQLIQDIGQTLGTGNIVTYVDSSGGEVLNRRAVQVATHPESQILYVTSGPCDPDDLDDPLTLNVVFPGGHQQYCDRFVEAAQHRTHRVQ